MKMIRSLTELTRTDLPLAGGKGANLGALIQAGLPVPPGFCVTTAGYRQFVAENNLTPQIQAALARTPTDDPLALDAASAAIRQHFTEGHVPEEMAAEVCVAYQALSAKHGGPAAVAVRSSATAEDLPDLSFAGQQDTYLNIIGEEALLDAVTRCWASLWTARAIGYRARNHISQEDVALAVVVQMMVQSESSGVLFTANPLTGKRGEVVIDATLGLGEALVSGMVEPDHYEVEDERILRKTLGRKATAVRGLAGGGTEVVTEAESTAAVQALPDEQILALADLGRQAEAFFGAPQDMEWARAGERLYVLQSRAITSFYPMPEWKKSDPLEVLFSFASWQGMLLPISPLGQDIFTGTVTGLGRAFGQQPGAVEQTLFLAGGDRLFVNITGLIRNPTSRNKLPVFMDAIDPISSGILKELYKDPRLASPNSKTSLKARLRLLRRAAPVLRGVLYNLLWPARGRARLERAVQQVIAESRAQVAGRDLPELLAAIENLLIEVPKILLPYLLPGVIAGQGPLQILLRMANSVEGGPRLAQDLTRGLPYNVTTEMDLKLWEVSRAIHADAPSAALFHASSAEELSARYQAGQLPPVAQAAVAGFLLAYGMRGVAEIDIYRRRWQDDPQHIIQVLKSYLEIDAAKSPLAVFQKGAETAQEARAALTAALRHTRHGWLKAALASFLSVRVHELGGLRETPKFTIIRVLGEIRNGLAAAGQKLAASGTLASPEDIFFLHLWELKKLASGSLPDARERIAQRQQSFAREMNRRRIPRIMLSDGTTYYESPAAISANSDHVLTGSPVSAGVVEGTVRVVLDPHGSRLLPGEILVCPATDPAWTPLFLAAGGLLMEVGGMMTHGSVVAREYGIPAVVGINEVTTRLKTGQRVRVDGSMGRVELLE